MRNVALLIALCAASLPAWAAPEPAGSCADARIPEPWTSWTQSGDAIAGGDAQSAPSLILGKPVLATLRPVAQVQYPAQPAKAQPKSHGGLFTVSLRQPARVGVGLSDRAWVDLVSGDAVQASVDHGHGPACSGIRKIVWFDLPPGRHIIQIADAASRQIRVMAADALANQPAPPAQDDGL